MVLSAARRGARVVFCARTLGEDAEAVLEEANELGTVEAVEADVSDEAGVDHLFEHTRAKLGEVDVLVSNAAICDDNLAVQMDVEQWDAVLATDLLGPILLARQMLVGNASVESPKNLVFLGSISHRGAVSQGNYAAAKAGLHGLVRSLAREYGAMGVAANVLVPGYVKTAMSARLPERYKQMLVDLSPLKRDGSPEELAQAAMFLAGVHPDVMNGRVVHASGGLLEVPS